MFCKQCGKEIDNDANFCVKCGTKVDNSNSQSLIVNKENKHIIIKKESLVFWLLISLVIITAYKIININNDTSATITADKNENIEVVKEEQKQKLYKEALEKKVQKNAVIRFTKENSPRTFAEWDDEWIKRINTNLPLVASKVAESNVCDTVTKVYLDEYRSTPKKEAIYQANCANYQKFYLSEKDLQDFVEVMSVSEITSKKSDDKYISLCEFFIRTNAEGAYSAYNFEPGASVHRRSDGSVKVSIPFEAKNSTLFTIVRREGLCLFDDSGLTHVSSSERLY